MAHEATHSSHDHGHGHGGGHHVTPISTYGKVLVILMVLMVATIGVAKWIHIESSLLNNLIAMGIACVKAVLVIMYFMGVKYSSGLTKIFAAMGFVFVTLMLLMMCDYMTRQYEPTAGWEKTARARYTQVTLPQVDERANERAHVGSGEGGH